ncbi:MAG: oxidoreductase [Acidobacteria bacterium]|nr:oxidoreductase [Acidobacteriota bacterium]
MSDVRLMTLDPGHFHAALVQKEMYPRVAPRVDVFAPLGPDLYEHLKRIDGFNRRAERPTSWDVEVHAGGNPLDRMLRDRPGNVVILSGRNRVKIDRILASVKNGLHVLADKPWILDIQHLPRLEAALAEAEQRNVVAYDIMTERFEVTSRVQRALVNDPAIFGDAERGSESEPAVYMESVHHLMKMVAGAPNIRPAWYFETAEQGEGLNDVGTHLVDLIQWTLFPDQAIDYRADVRVLSAQRWPTWISEADFRRVTNQPAFPPALSAAVKDGRLEYYCNTLVTYTLRGVHATLNVIWDWEPQAGAGDIHYASYRGTRARIDVRQTHADRYRPELYVIPADPASIEALLAAVQRRLPSLASEFPGVGVERRGGELHVAIPDALRLGHEAHFAQVARSFLDYLQDRSRLPAWERPNMLAKYYVTTKGTELARANPPREGERRAPR